MTFHRYPTVPGYPTIGILFWISNHTFPYQYQNLFKESRYHMSHTVRAYLQPYTQFGKLGLHNGGATP